MTRIVPIALLGVLLTGCNEGRLQAVPNPLDFHARVVGSTSEEAVWTFGVPRVTLAGPGVIDGPDAANFQVVRPLGAGDWDGIQREMSFTFTPTRRGVFNATYTTTSIHGTVDVIELTGIGAHDVMTGVFDHTGSLPDGLDFQQVCFHKSRDLMFTATNKSDRDQLGVFIFGPADPAFTLLPSEQRIKATARNGGTATWTIRYTPASAAASDSGGLTVYRFSHWDDRTGVLLKGQGKEC